VFPLKVFLEMIRDLGLDSNSTSQWMALYVIQYIIIEHAAQDINGP
jgi:hypothetical protein